MGHWVTLDDDQHVYISDGGKVLATRSKISSAGGAKERGKSLAARSKAAIGRVRNKVSLREFGRSTREQEAKEYTPRYQFERGEKPKGRVKSAADLRAEKQNAALEAAVKTGTHDKYGDPIKQSPAAPATARTIEHAKTEAVAHNKAKGRGTPERAAMAKYYREDRANTIAAKAALAKATASTRNPVMTQGVELTGKPGNAPHVAASKFKVPTELKVPEKVRACGSRQEQHRDARAGPGSGLGEEQTRGSADEGDRLRLHRPRHRARQGGGAIAAGAGGEGAGGEGSDGDRAEIPRQHGQGYPQDSGRQRRAGGGHQQSVGRHQQTGDDRPRDGEGQSLHEDVEAQSRNPRWTRGR